jgi:hypothetical protein
VVHVVRELSKLSLIKNDFSSSSCRNSSGASWFGRDNSNSNLCESAKRRYPMKMAKQQSKKKKTKTIVQTYRGILVFLPAPTEPATPSEPT